jgi:hypothetical protein
MARYNEILVGRYNRFIQKLLGMKGGPPSPQLASEIGAGFVLSNGAENRYLESWDRFASAISNPGVAGQLSTVKLRNPIGSNVVAVIEKVLVSTPNTDTAGIDLQGGIDQTDGAIVSGTLGAGWDTRGRTQATCILSRSQNAAPVGMAAKARILLISNTPWEFIGTDIAEFPMLPGSSMQVVRNTGGLNNDIFVSFWWRERFLEESERA